MEKISHFQSEDKFLFSQSSRTIDKLKAKSVVQNLSNAGGKKQIKKTWVIWRSQIVGPLPVLKMFNCMMNTWENNKSFRLAGWWMSIWRTSHFLGQPNTLVPWQQNQCVLYYRSRMDMKHLNLTWYSWWIRHSFFETPDQQYEHGVDNLPLFKGWWTSEGVGHIGGNLRGDNSGRNRWECINT